MYDLRLEIIYIYILMTSTHNLLQLTYTYTCTVKQDGCTCIYPEIKISSTHLMLIFMHEGSEIVSQEYFHRVRLEEYMIFHVLLFKF